jgi:predicted ester cyclase
MAQDNASVIKNAAEAFNKGQAEGLNKVFGGGRDKYAAEALKSLRGAFPDLHYTVDHVSGDGSHVEFAYTVKGTHKGALDDIKATNKAAQWHGSGTATIQNGMITDISTTEDWARVRIQLGLANPSMTGTWKGSGQGTTVTLVLTQTGTAVSGTATVSGIPGSFPLAGTNNFPNVVLKGTVFGLTVNFTGAFSNPNTIPGTLTIQGFSPQAVTLTRS